MNESTTGAEVGAAPSPHRLCVIRESLRGRRKGFRWRLIRGRSRWTVSHTREVQQFADDLDAYFRWILDELEGKSHADAG